MTKNFYHINSATTVLINVTFSNHINFLQFPRPDTTAHSFIIKLKHDSRVINCKNYNPEARRTWRGKLSKGIFFYRQALYICSWTCRSCTPLHSCTCSNTRNRWGTMLLLSRTYIYIRSRFALICASPRSTSQRSDCTLRSFFHRSPREIADPCRIRIIAGDRSSPIYSLLSGK